MGCATSKEDINDINPNAFLVHNVDDRGNSGNEGHLEIMGMDLVLHQRGKDAIQWPLKCLRRYGFDQDLFSFESGRRCPTGPGIYAFRCRRAETLFNMLQECIQQAGQDMDPSPSPTAPTGLLINTMSSSRPNSFSELRTASPVLRNGYSTNQVPGMRTLPTSVHVTTGRVGQPLIREHLYINGAPNQCGSSHSLGSSQRNSRHEYLNASPADVSVHYNNVDPRGIALTLNIDSNGNDSKILNYAELDLPKSSENLNEIGRQDKPTTVNASDHDNPVYKNDSSAFKYANTGKREPLNKKVSKMSKLGQPMYINVGAEAKKTEFHNGARMNTTHRLSSSSSSEHQNSYANLELALQNDNLHIDAAKRRVNYIQLDLDRNDDVKGMGNVPPSPLSLTVPDSPNRRTESYATIDFNKTTALSNSQRNPTDDGESVRKTRHDSTANDLY